MDTEDILGFDQQNNFIISAEQFPEFLIIFNGFIMFFKRTFKSCCYVELRYKDLRILQKIVSETEQRLAAE